MSIPASNKSRGRPRTGIGKALGVRLYPDTEAALDAWIKSQPEPPSRHEAVRLILAEFLRERGYLPKG